MQVFQNAVFSLLFLQRKQGRTKREACVSELKMYGPVEKGGHLG